MPLQGGSGGSVLGSLNTVSHFRNLIRRAAARAATHRPTFATPCCAPPTRSRTSHSQRDDRRTRRSNPDCAVRPRSRSPRCTTLRTSNAAKAVAANPAASASAAPPRRQPSPRSPRSSTRQKSGARMRLLQRGRGRVMRLRGPTSSSRNTLLAQGRSSSSSSSRRRRGRRGRPRRSRRGRPMRSPGRPPRRSPGRPARTSTGCSSTTRRVVRRRRPGPCGPCARSPCTTRSSSQTRARRW